VSVFTIFFGVFLVLHGLVHLLYAAQSRRLFELAPGLRWPDGSWAFARLHRESTTRRLAGFACATAAALFVVGGAGLLLQQEWWRPVVVAAAVLSAVVYVLLWDGTRRKLNEQGWLGVLIDLVLLGVLIAAGWPSVSP
jgi:hypothetical protein